MRSRVLFVCLGNICRSPMAHGVMHHRVRERGVADRFDVDSCGTGGWHVGERADPRTLEVLRSRGIRLDHRARQLSADDGERFDWIFTMDRSNERDTKRVIPAHHHDRVHSVLSITTGGDVPDPYYGGPGGFEEVFEMLDVALDAWLDRILAQ